MLTAILNSPQLYSWEDELLLDGFHDPELTFEDSTEQAQEKLTYYDPETDDPMEIFRALKKEKIHQDKFNKIKDGFTLGISGLLIVLHGKRLIRASIKNVKFTGSKLISFTNFKLLIKSSQFANNYTIAGVGVLSTGITLIVAGASAILWDMLFPSEVHAATLSCYYSRNLSELFKLSPDEAAFYIEHDETGELTESIFALGELVRNMEFDK